MSTLTIKLPTAELRWWCIRLPRNDEGHVLLTETDGVSADGTAYNWSKEPTKVIYTIFDHLDEEIEGVVACGTQTRGRSVYLYLLCDHQPTSDPRWQPLEPVVLYPPFESHIRDIPDIGQYAGKAREL